MTESEPHGWELMRAINDLKSQTQRMHDSMLTEATFALYQQHMETKIKGVSEDIANEKADRKADVAELNTRVTDRSNFQRKVWASVLVAVLGAVLSFVVTLVNTGAS